MKQPDLALFLATSGHSGVDRIMRNLVPAFAAHGLTIDLLCVRGHGPHWSSALPANARKIDLGAAHVLTAIPALLRYLAQHKPRALLSDKYKVNRAALLACALASRRTRVGVRVGTTVSTDLEHRSAFERWFERASIRWLYRFAHCILTPSAGAAQDLAQIAGLPAAAVNVVPSPVITPELIAQAALDPEHRWLQPGQPPVILGVGELTSRKNFPMLLRAFALLRRQRDCRLIIGGEGKGKRKLQDLAQQLGVADDVDFPGFLNNPYAYMRRAKVFALTSQWEGMPVVLIEAMALGTPVVATDCPSGPRELLREGLYGPLVERDDFENLARCLAQLLDAPTPADKLCEASLPYSVDNSAKNYLRALGLL